MNAHTHTQSRGGASTAHLFVNLFSPYENKMKSYFNYG